MGPISPEIRAELGAEDEENEAWKAIPGGLYLKFPVAKARVVLELLKDPLDHFVDEAMARMRRRIDPASHVPEAVTYLSNELGRELPHPELGAVETEEADEDDVTDDETDTNRAPVVRGRPPIFEKSHRSIVSLLADVEHGRLALPDLQRPFVWEDTKVRDLLDSLFASQPSAAARHRRWRSGPRRSSSGRALCSRTNSSTPF